MPVLSKKNKVRRSQRAESDPVEEDVEGAEEEEEMTEDEAPEEEAEGEDEDGEEEESASAGALAERRRTAAIHGAASDLGLALDSEAVVACVNNGTSLDAAYPKLIKAAKTAKPKAKAKPAGPSRMGSTATATAGRVTPTIAGNGGGGAMPEPATFAEAIDELQAEAGGRPITRARAARLAADRYPDLYRSENEAAHRKMPRNAKDPSA